MRSRPLAIPALGLLVLAASSASAGKITVTWDPSAADGFCRTLVSGLGYQYLGKWDIIASLPYGALSGTIAADVSIGDGKIEREYTIPAQYTQTDVIVDGCCISPDYKGGPKYRCVTGGAYQATIKVSYTDSTTAPPPSPPTSSYPTCPNNLDLTYLGRLGNGRSYYGYTGTAGWTQCVGCTGGADPSWKEPNRIGLCAAAGAAPPTAPSYPTCPDNQNLVYLGRLDNGRSYYGYTGTAGWTQCVGCTGGADPSWKIPNIEGICNPPSGGSSSSSGSGSGAGGYPICPANKQLTYVSAISGGSGYLWSYDSGVQCSGCPTGSTWNPAESKCVL